MVDIFQKMLEWKGINGCYFPKDFEDANNIRLRDIGIHPYSVDVEKFFRGIDIDSSMVKELIHNENERCRDDCCGESEWGGLKGLFRLKVKWMEQKAQREQVAAGVIQKSYRRWSAKRAMTRAMWSRQHPGGNLLRAGDNHPVAIAKLKLDNLRAEHKERERQKAEVLEAGFKALQEWSESG